MDSIVEPIKLDIGGTVFETCKLKLTKFDGFFKTMLTSDIPVTFNFIFYLIFQLLKFS